MKTSFRWELSEFNNASQESSELCSAFFEQESKYCLSIVCLTLLREIELLWDTAPSQPSYVWLKNEQFVVVSECVIHLV